MKYSRRKLGRIVTWLGACISLIVTIALPGVFLLVASSQLHARLSFLAELKAARLAKYIYLHQDLWEYQTLRLAEITEVPEATAVTAQQRVFGTTGKLLLETGTIPPFPVMRWQEPVVVGGATVATVETVATARPLLVETTVIAILAGLLGLGIFLTIRILPLRIIDRTLLELAAVQARYRLLFDANPFPMVVVHRTSLAFLAVNAAAIERYGWSRDEFLAMGLADLCLPEAGPALRPLVETIAPGKGASMFSGQRHHTKDGTVIEVEITTRAIEFDRQPAALSLIADVTLRNRLEDQLRQSQKMEAVGQLTGGIAHDFNNILAIILANVEALEEDDHGEATLGRLKGIDAAVDRAATLTRQLLSFSRQQPLRPETTDLNDLIAATSKLLRRALGPQVEIRSLLAATLWPVNIDRTQLETCLVNLCLNARDAMSKGGKLVLETRNVTLDEGQVLGESDVAAGDYAMLAVTDNGTGMPPDILAKVFDPFFTTKEVGKGSGLGLSMVYGFVKQSKGHMTVYSSPGQGSTFRLYLPRTARAAGSGATRQKAAMPRGSERVLVVDDEAGVRALAVEQLRSLGYDVAEAVGGAAGLAAFESAEQPYDLLLTDVAMPQMDGKALADAVAVRWPRTKMAFMSGYAESAIAHHGNIDAGVLLLSKPFRKIELAKIVRGALDGA